MSRRIGLLIILAAAALLRLSNWSHIVDRGRIFIDEPDGYYHLRRAVMTFATWPRVPQFDPMLNWPAGGLIPNWPPLFDGLLATLALPWRTAAATSWVGAFLPPFLGVVQIGVLYLLMKRLAGDRAALVATIVAALLPGVVRYTLFGALDLDPFFELAFLVALLGVVSERWMLVATGLFAAILSWAGATIAVVIITAVIVVTRKREAARAASYGSAVTGVLILPFVFTRIGSWTTFEGLSLLHVAVLAGASFVCAMIAGGLRRLAIVSAIVAAVLAPFIAVPFFGGMRYAAADVPMLSLIAEAQPLFRLLGHWDLRAMLIRFGLLPLFFAGFAIFWAIRRRTFAAQFVFVWSAIFFALAVLHSRFSYDAAIALSAFAGVAFADLVEFAKPRVVAGACVLALLPALPAYADVPGFEPFNLYRHADELRETEMDLVCEALRGRVAPGGEGVLAPWSFGHWILWLAGKPVVLSPFLGVGQSGFVDGMRFSFDEPADAARFLRTHRVGWLIVTPEWSSIEMRARAAGIDSSRFVSNGRIDWPQYMQTVAARLTYWGPGEVRTLGRVYPPLTAYREVIRTNTAVHGPFGPVPLVRVYEVLNTP